MPVVRPAIAADARRIGAILIRSITDLCRDDHRGDADLLADWTGTKSLDDIRRWLDGPHHMLVSEGPDGRPAAVAMYSDQGEILLLYIDPDHRFAGHSKALLRQMEHALRTGGHARAHLTSTTVARPFYRRLGWCDAPPAADSAAETGYPMSKTLIHP